VVAVAVVVDLLPTEQKQSLHHSLQSVAVGHSQQVVVVFDLPLCMVANPAFAVVA
jgi:hypothetical protein